jgi:hypothetical protein
MSICHLYILSSRSIVDLLKPLGYGSHCREGVNGNPILDLDYFSLLERLAQSLVRSIAAPFDYAWVPFSEGTAPCGTRPSSEGKRDETVSTTTLHNARSRDKG